MEVIRQPAFSSCVAQVCRRRCGIDLHPHPRARSSSAGRGSGPCSAARCGTERRDRCCPRRARPGIPASACTAESVRYTVRSFRPLPSRTLSRLPGQIQVFQAQLLHLAQPQAALPEQVEGGPVQQGLAALAARTWLSARALRSRPAAVSTCSSVRYLGSGRAASGRGCAAATGARCSLPPAGRAGRSASSAARRSRP